MKTPHAFLMKRGPARTAVAVLAILGLMIFMTPITPAQAAGLTSLKDVMSTITDGAQANHTFSWVSPSGVANGSTIVITFPTGFDLSDPITEDDVDIAGSTEGELTTAADCTSTENASVERALQVITITLCTGDGGDFTNSETITVEIGTHASASGTGANQITNQSAAQNASDPKITVASGASDTGTLAVEIIADDSVSVTATVDPSVTFSISDVAIGFGSLNASAARYANAAATGSDTVVAAHTFSIGTNAASGVAVTYNGATLTSGANTIDVGTITAAGGTPGQEEFGIGFDDNGTAFTIAAGYDESADDYKFVASTTTTIISSAAPLASTNVDAHYIANISAATEAGSYTTSITYVATGTF